MLRCRLLLISNTITGPSVLTKAYRAGLCIVHCIMLRVPVA